MNYRVCDGPIPDSFLHEKIGMAAKIPSTRRLEVEKCMIIPHSRPSIDGAINWLQMEEDYCRRRYGRAVRSLCRKFRLLAQRR
jgi:hypothetical protein